MKVCVALRGRGRRGTTTCRTTSRCCTRCARVRDVAGLGHRDRAAPPHRRAPAHARDYVKFIEDFAGVPVTFVGVGPARDQTVVPLAPRCARVLVVGSGGREHALAGRSRARRRSTRCSRAPGNAGMAGSASASRRRQRSGRGRRPAGRSTRPSSSSDPRSRSSPASSTRPRPGRDLAFGPAPPAPLEGSKAWMKDGPDGARSRPPGTQPSPPTRRTRRSRSRDAARALRREDRRPRGGQGRDRHRVARRGTRRGARVPVGRVRSATPAARA